MRDTRSRKWQISWGVLAPPMQPSSLTRRGRRCSRRRRYARFSRRTTSIFFSHQTLVKLASTTKTYPDRRKRRSPWAGEDEYRIWREQGEPVAPAIRMLSALREEPSRERLDGRTGVPTTRCRAPTTALSQATTSRRALGCYMHGGPAGRLAGDAALCLSGAVYAASARRGAVAIDPRASATVAARCPGCMVPAMTSPASGRLGEPSPWWARGWTGVRAG